MDALGIFQKHKHFLDSVDMCSVDMCHVAFQQVSFGKPPNAENV